MRRTLSGFANAASVMRGCVFALLPLVAAAQGPLRISTTSLADGVTGVPYSATVTATGGRTPYVWTISAGALPAGLTLNLLTGVISGTPTTAATFPFTVRVTDALLATTTQALQIVIRAPLVITTATLPDGVVGTAYSQTLAATGGAGGYAWSLALGTLPAGLSLSAAGTISGTPSAAGANTFTAQVRDSAGVLATKALSLTISPPALAITTTSLPNGTVGTAYSQTLAASGGTGGYTWSDTLGALPAGLTLAAGGLIGGVPTAAGPSTFTVQVKDSAGVTATLALGITINSPALAITTTALPNGTVGTAYSQTLAATGGTGGYTWSVTLGALPAGLALAATGAMSGTPSTFGSSSFTAKVTDAAGATATQALTLAINPPQLTIATSSLPGGEVGVSYSQSLAAAGGTGGYSWSVTVGGLPAGLTLSAGGGIGGTPSAAGSAAFTVQVKDSAGSTATAALTIAVAPAVTVTTASLPFAVTGVAYSQALSAAGGAGGYIWSIASGSPPPGITLQSNGALTGTPATAGSFSFAARVIDAASAQATRSFTLAVTTPVSIATPGALPAGEVGAVYTATLSAGGGVPPYGWSMSAGQLPNGLALNAGTGAITGSPALAGSFTFTAAATDSNGLSASGDFSITIHSAVAIATGANLVAAAGSPFSQVLGASGGILPYAWSLVSGTLPAGLSFNAATATINGVPAQVGAFPLTFQVSDAASGSARGSFVLTVTSGLTIITAPALPAGAVGTPYSAALQPAGGAPPYVWTVTDGALPGGLTFNAGGQIDGTPTAAGAFTFTTQVVDGNSNRASKQFTLAVAAALTITSAPALPGGQAGLPYQQTLTAAGGSPPYLWLVTTGSAPPGLKLDGATGLLSGTPSASGTFTFTVTVSDSATLSAQKQFSVVVGAGVSFTTPASLPNATVGAAYSFTLGAAGGQSPYSWSITQGSAPPGLSLNASTGAISGTPTAQGTYNFAVQVTDAGRASASRVHSMVVGLPASAPVLNINGLGATLSVLQQPAIDITLASAYPLAITGRLNVAFSPGGANPVDDPSIQFSTGGRSAAFSIPANSLHAVFSATQFAVQAGSETGTLTFTIDSLQAGGAPLPAPAGLTVQVSTAPPSLRGMTLVRTSNGFQVQVVAVSSTRELTQATVRFTPSAGSSLQTSEVDVALGDAMKAWFQSSASAQYGGQFTLTLPFTFVGAVGGLDSVSVALVNSVGSSSASSAPY